MQNLAIKVSNLGKAYRIGLKEKKQETLAGSIIAALKAPIRNFRKISRRTNCHFARCWNSYECLRKIGSFRPHRTSYAEYALADQSRSHRIVLRKH